MSEWISAKKELPSKRGEYLCYTPSCEVEGIKFGPAMRVLVFTGRRFMTSMPIAHWMPLPDIPETPHAD